MTTKVPFALKIIRNYQTNKPPTTFAMSQITKLTYLVIGELLFYVISMFGPTELILNIMDLFYGSLAYRPKYALGLCSCLVTDTGYVTVGA